MDCPIMLLINEEVSQIFKINRICFVEINHIFNTHTHFKYLLHESINTKNPSYL